MLHCACYRLKIHSNIWNIPVSSLSIVLEGSSENTSLAHDAALCCLKNADSIFRDHMNHFNALAAMIFPLLLIAPKVLLFNLYLYFLNFFVFHSDTSLFSDTEVKFESTGISQGNKLAPF